MLERARARTCIGTATSVLEKAHRPRNTLLVATALEDLPALASTIYARMLLYIMLKRAVVTLSFCSVNVKSKKYAHGEKASPEEQCGDGCNVRMLLRRPSNCRNECGEDKYTEHCAPQTHLLRYE